MPLYEYQCESCNNRFEKIQKSYSDPAPEACPKCGKGPVRKLISSPAIQFKGTGWYITDYAQKGKTGTTDSSGAEKSDTKSTETKGADAKSSDTGSSSTATPPSSPAKTASSDS